MVFIDDFINWEKFREKLKEEQIDKSIFIPDCMKSFILDEKSRIKVDYLKELEETFNDHLTEGWQYLLLHHSRKITKEASKKNSVIPTEQNDISNDIKQQPKVPPSSPVDSDHNDSILNKLNKALLTNTPLNSINNLGLMNNPPTFDGSTRMRFPENLPQPVVKSQRIAVKLGSDFKLPEGMDPSIIHEMLQDYQDRMNLQLQQEKNNKIEASDKMNVDTTKDEDEVDQIEKTNEFDDRLRNDDIIIVDTTTITNEPQPVPMSCLSQDELEYHDALSSVPDVHDENKDKVALQNNFELIADSDCGSIDPNDNSDINNEDENNYNNFQIVGDVDTVSVWYDDCLDMFELSSTEEKDDKHLHDALLFSTNCPSVVEDKQSNTKSNDYWNEDQFPPIFDKQHLATRVHPIFIKKTYKNYKNSNRQARLCRTAWCE